jgi:hypothetical protein
VRRRRRNRRRADVILFATRVLASPFVLLAEFDGIQSSRARIFWSSLNLAPSQSRQLAWVLWRLEANRSLGTYRTESVSEFVALLDEWREEQVQAVRSLLEVEERFRLAASELKRAERRYDELHAPTQKVGLFENAARMKREAEEAAETGAEELANAESRVKRAQNELRVSEQLAARLLAATQYEYVKQRFDTSRFWIVLAAGLASAGVLAFVIATSSPK